MKLAVACSFVVLASAGAKSLANKEDGLCQPEYHATPILYWPVCDDGTDIQAQETGINKSALGGKATIAIKYDHASFDALYDKENKKAKARDRIDHGPTSECFQGAIGELSRYDGTIFSVLSTQGTSNKIPDTAQKEFIQKVKTITCAYDGSISSSPTLELKGTNLTFKVKDGGNSAEATLKEMKRLFPKFKQVHDEFFDK